MYLEGLGAQEVMEVTPRGSQHTGAARAGSPVLDGDNAPGSDPMYQRSPTFLAPGTDFLEDNFSMDWGRRMVSE